ncbi:hypothetical protein [Kytococcus sedentarius]|uniref:hypothetical protein n=1 Tax=Kytococcus sedentarius TaxID=1276 RepID=UPI0035BBCB23
MDRRTLLLGVPGVLTLTACGGDGFDDALNAAAVDVEGVYTASLTSGRDAGFGHYVSGQLSTSGEGPSAAAAIFEKALQAVARVCVEEKGEEVGRNHVVGGIVARAEDGDSLDIWDVRPSLRTSRERLDNVTAGDFLP